MPTLAKGEFALVEKIIQNAWERPAQPIRNGTMAHEHDLYMLLTEAGVQCRDLTALQRYAPALEDLAVRDGHRLYRAVAGRARGMAHRLAGEFTEAEACLNQAEKLFADYGARWQLGRTYFERGELGAANGDLELARRGYTQALAEFEAMQAMPDVERTREALRALD